MKDHNSELIAKARKMKGDFATNLYRLSEAERPSIWVRFKKFLADVGEAAAWAIRQ